MYDKLYRSTRNAYRTIQTGKSMSPQTSYIITVNKLTSFCIADENDSDLRYSEVPLTGKNKTLVKILGGRQHVQDDPCRSNIGGVATPAALTPMAPTLDHCSLSHISSSSVYSTILSREPISDSSRLVVQVVSVLLRGNWQYFN